jgi:hypothetical protein
MSDINLQVNTTDITSVVNVDTTTIEINPEPIALNIYSGGYATPTGNTGEIQFNNNGILAGSPNLLYETSNTTVVGINSNFSGNGNFGNLSVTGTTSLGNVGNVTITGGNSGQYLQTNGSGNLSWQTISTNAAGANTTIQYNNANAFAGSNTFTYNNGTDTVSMTNLNVSGSSNLGSESNVVITGGINGYYLQTDGTGNLTWTAGTGNITGNGTVGGSNTQIQFNDAGNFAGNAGFTFNKTTGDVDIPGNLVITETVKIAQAIENVSLIGAQTGTYNFNILDGAIRYSTANASANLTVNFRGNSTVTANTMLANGQSTIGTYLLTTGANAYTITTFQVDGANQTVKWVGGTTPPSLANTISSFTINIVKTSTTPTYTLLGSVTRYS